MIYPFKTVILKQFANCKRLPEGTDVPCMPCIPSTGDLAMGE